MRQLLKSKPETMLRQNVELRAKLARADRLIAQLRAEASQLRAQLAQWQRSSALSPAEQRRTTRRSRAKAFGFVTDVAKSTRSLPSQRSSRRSSNRLPFIRLLLQRRVDVALVAIVSLSAVLFLSAQPVQQRSPLPSSSQSPQAVQPQTTAELVYNVPQPPPLEHSATLQAIVDGAVALAANKKLPTEPLSITLINLKTNQVAGYQNQTPRYPASIVKLFWLVACEAQLEQGLLHPDSGLGADLTAMIVHSDNDAASRVFDRITQTTSGTALSGVEYDRWLKQRLQLNHFFQAAGYNGLSISQKNYPIDSLKLEEPDAREQQMRDAQQSPIRSMVTTDQAARLLYEIYAGKAVSAVRSQEMMALLTRDLQPKEKSDGAIAGFLGESLPADVRFASKVGMTTKARHEVAIVTSKDGKTAYILAVFGGDPTYSQDGDILPAISAAVSAQMMAPPATASGV